MNPSFNMRRMDFSISPLLTIEIAPYFKYALILGNLYALDGEFPHKHHYSSLLLLWI